MALSNNEKQKRHKKLEALKKYGNDVLIHLIITISGINRNYEKSNEELKEEINKLVNLPNGWTEDDYQYAVKKIKKLYLLSYENHQLLNNDINEANNLMNSKITDLKIKQEELRKARYKAPETVKNIKSTLKLTELSKSDQIAVVAEVMRQLAKELLDEKSIPETMANAIAFSLIGSHYEKPEWTWNILAKNLSTQSTEKNINKLITELKNLNIKNEEVTFNE